jgi:thiamine biosynthesis protein ThiS
LRIQVNGEVREVEDKLTLPELIACLSLKPEQIAIELNQKVVRRAEWQATILREDDKVEIVHFVGGGCGARSRRAEHEVETRLCASSVASVSLW